MAASVKELAAAGCDARMVGTQLKYRQQCSSLLQQGHTPALNLRNTYISSNGPWHSFVDKAQHATGTTNRSVGSCMTIKPDWKARPLQACSAHLLDSRVEICLPLEQALEEVLPVVNHRTAPEQSVELHHPMQM